MNMQTSFKNKLDDKLMLLSIKVTRRKRINKPKIILQWPEIQKIVAEQYTVPNGYELGQCLDMHHILDNSEDSKCEKVWRFELVEKKKRTSRKASTKKTSSRKK
tara:strand:+ start:217 stop:528 length:312 start_codon:yes stop_codon:yes gene_type:complete